MKARLANGQIITLEKDCGCIIHEGPHWLHMDEVSRKLNYQILERGGQFAGIAFAREERVRLQNKERNMTTRNIVEIIREDTD